MAMATSSRCNSRQSSSGMTSSGLAKCFRKCPDRRLLATEHRHSVSIASAWRSSRSADSGTTQAITPSVSMTATAIWVTWEGLSCLESIASVTRWSSLGFPR